MIKLLLNYLIGLSVGFACILLLVAFLDGYNRQVAETYNCQLEAKTKAEYWKC